MPKSYGFTIKGKIEYWIKCQKPGVRFKAKWLHRELLEYDASRSAINYALKEFEINGLIKKSIIMQGRNQEWEVNKPKNDGC